MLRKLLVSDKLPLNMIAEKTNLSTSAISKYINKRNEISLTNILKITREFYPHLEEKIMREYILSIHKPENLRLALEYSSFNGDMSQFNQLIEQNLNSNNSLNREWAEIYSFLLERHLQTKTPQELFNLLRDISTSCSELKILLRMIEVYCFYDQRKYFLLAELSEGLESDISKIENEYIKETYLIRLSQVYSNMYLRYFYNVEKTRLYAQNVIESHASITFKASAYMTIAYSYLFEDYERCIVNFEYAIELVKGKDELNQLAQIIQKGHFFAKCYYHDVNLETMLVIDESETFLGIEDRIFYEIALGNHEKAIQLLDKIEEPTPFSLFYSGLLFDNIDFFYISLNQFKKQGDKLFANLPKRELERRAVKSVIIDALYE